MRGGRFGQQPSNITLHNRHCEEVVVPQRVLCGGGGCVYTKGLLIEESTCIANGNGHDPSCLVLITAMKGWREREQTDARRYIG